MADYSEIVKRLRDELEEMANQASVDFELWNRFSNRVLTAAVNIEAQAKEIAELEADNERLRGVIERDRTKAAEIIGKARAVVMQRSWLVEGRGCYSYDDETYQSEFGDVFREMLEALEPLKILAADWSDCPNDFQSARINWKEKAEQKDARITELEAENAKLREAMKACSDDLEAELLARYGFVKGGPIHPAENKRFQRDMAPVRATRAALGE
jgi:cell division protein FtsB